jgi:hypothetical protein
MRVLVTGALFAALLAAQQTTRQYSIYTTDPYGRLVPGAIRDEARTPTSSGETTRMRSVNGRLVPSESIYERILYQDARQKITERVRQLHDYDGRPLPQEKTRTEERRNPDGSETVIKTSYQQDLHGRFTVQERATSRVVDSGSVRREATVVERPDLNGGMQVFQKANSTETKTDTHEQRQVVTYRKGINGDFYEASRQIAERVEQPGQVTETITGFEMSGTGRMEPAIRVSTRTRTMPDKSEVEESTIYRSYTAGRVGGSGGLHLSEQLLVERKPGPGNTVNETTSVRTPSLNHPYSLGRFEKVSEVVCRGNCRREEQ